MIVLLCILFVVSLMQGEYEYVFVCIFLFVIGLMKGEYDYLLVCICFW